MRREQSRERDRWRTYTHARLVYFIGAGDFIKIGRTTCLGRRLHQFRTANPYPLELVNAIRADDHPERWFHERFAAERVKGEWFTRTDEIESIAHAYDPADLKVVRFFMADYPTRRAVLPEIADAHEINEIVNRTLPTKAVTVSPDPTYMGGAR